MADSNKYRRGTGIKYKNSSLSVGESMEFLGSINKRGERKCIAIVKRTVIRDSVISTEEDVCGRKFMSEGYHNRKCPKCSTREAYARRMNMSREEPLVYRTHASGVRSTAFHSEVGE